MAALLALKAKGFAGNFTEASATIVPGEKSPRLTWARSKPRKAQADQPAKWQLKEGINEFLFVPDLYVIQDGKRRAKGYFILQRFSHEKSIPNTFFYPGSASASRQRCAVSGS